MTLIDPSTGSTAIHVRNWNAPFFTGSSFTRTGADHVRPPSREAATNTSGSPLRASIQLTYSDPRFGPALRSTPVTGMPFDRSTPSPPRSQPPGMSAIFLSAPNVSPASLDTSNTRPAGPAHTTYTSPFVPTDGTTPSTALSLS